MCKGGSKYDRCVHNSALAVWRFVCAVPVLKQDAALYGASAIYAFTTGAVAFSSGYREWGWMAGVAYACGVIVCFAAACRRGLRAQSVRRVRRVVVLLLLFGAVIAPLSAELSWRAAARPGAHAQPEVPVIERAGDRAAHHHNPYPQNPQTVGTPPSSDAPNVDANSFFPYLPGMVPFGAINALPLPKVLTDARVALAGFTLIVTTIALWLSNASPARKGRVLQWLVILPTGALPMVTGGDDLPVLALMLLGIVLAQQRRPVWAGIVMGLGATLKFTAWPLMVLMLLAVRDRELRRAPLRYGLAAFAVIVPVIALGAAASPSAFVENVISFPLGLARVKSPAASPLVGQVLTNLWPNHRTFITTCLLLVGVAIVVWALGKWQPHTPPQVALFTAFAAFGATLLAPATRFGYLDYPADLVAWAYLLYGMKDRAGWLPNGAVAYSSSSTSNTRISTEVVGAAISPASAGVIEEPCEFGASARSNAKAANIARGAS